MLRASAITERRRFIRRESASLSLSRLLLPPPTSVVLVKLNIARIMAWGRAAVYYKHFLCAAAAASQKPKSTRAYVFVSPHGAVKFAALSLVLRCWGLIVARVCATRTIRGRNRCTIPSHLVLLELQLARPLKVMNGGACDALSGLRSHPARVPFDFGAEMRNKICSGRQLLI